jgi:hypothetical protein
MLFFVFLALTIATWIYYGQLTKKIEREFCESPNICPPDGLAPGCLTSINFIGFGLFGDFRHMKVGEDDTYVTYQMISFIIPLIPIGCYRCKFVDYTVAGEKYLFLGSEEMKGNELLCIYLNALRYILPIFTFFSAFALFV